MLAVPHVFDDDHLPREYPHRETELEQCFRCLNPALQQNHSGHLLVSGPSGVGKSSLSRFALTELRSQATITTAKVRCLESTPADIARSMLKAMTTASVPHTYSAVQALDELDERLSKPAIVILDEADELAKWSITCLQ